MAAQIEGSPKDENRRKTGRYACSDFLLARLCKQRLIESRTKHATRSFLRVSVPRTGVIDVGVPRRTLTHHLPSRSRPLRELPEEIQNNETSTCPRRTSIPKPSMVRSRMHPQKIKHQEIQVARPCPFVTWPKRERTGVPPKYSSRKPHALFLVGGRDVAMRAKVHVCCHFWSRTICSQF